MAHMLQQLFPRGTLPSRGAPGAATLSTLSCNAFKPRGPMTRAP